MADTNEIRTQEQWLCVIARALSYLCVQATDLKDADLAPKALLLESFGLPRRDVATMLGTTENTVRVTVNAAKSGKRGGKARGGKKKK
jgi:hypothetical protein